MVEDVCPELGISVKTGLRIGQRFPSFLVDFLMHKQEGGDGDDDCDDDAVKRNQSWFASVGLEELFVSYLVLISHITRFPLAFDRPADEQLGEHSLDVLRVLGIDPIGEDGGNGKHEVDDHDRWMKGRIPVWDLVDRSPVAVRHHLLSSGKPIFPFLRMGIRPLATFASVNVLHQQRLLIRENFSGHDGLTSPLVTGVLILEEKKKQKKKWKKQKKPSEHSTTQPRGFSRRDRIEKSRFALPFFSFQVDGPVFGEVAYLLWKQIQTAYFQEQNVMNRIASIITRFEIVLWELVEREKPSIEGDRFPLPRPACTSARYLPPF
jgi:hypothetical protein